MIVKELDPYPAGSAAGDTFARAGRQAEEQMAFYLRRAFGEKKDVHVLNGIRLERDDDAAQIDHLIVHRGGMVIVESKSVHGRVRVNEHGEWVRVYGSRQQGMASPIEQAKRQADFLRRYLSHHAPELAGKLLGLLQASFGALTVDVVVAISDTGIIDRPKKLPLPEVCKADQAAQKIDDLLAKQRRESNLLTGSWTSKSGRELSRSEIDNILAFLPAHHRPYRPGKGDAEAQAAPEPTPIPAGEQPAPESTLAPLAPLGAHDETAIAGEVCAFCGRPLTPKVAAYCRDNAAKFGGHLYCFDHQRASKRRAPANGPESER